jgi:hypothetical protein
VVAGLVESAFFLGGEGLKALAVDFIEDAVDLSFQIGAAA